MTTDENKKPRISVLCVAVGKVIAARRAYLKRPFKKFCREAGCTDAYLYLLENGRMNMSINYLEALAKSLGMTASGVLKKAEKEVVRGAGKSKTTA